MEFELYEHDGHLYCMDCLREVMREEANAG